MEHTTEAENATIVSPRTDTASASLSALDPGIVGEIVQMALSDHIPFDHIRVVHGLSPDAVKALMRRTLKPGSYRAWRKRVREFSDRRATYK